MRIAAIQHFSMPWRNAGSETVMAELLKAAVQSGHEATVYCTHKDGSHNWTGREPVEWADGVKILRCRNVILAGNLAARTKPDVIVSHHDHSMHAIRLAKKIGARSVFISHNDFDINERPLRLRPDLVIFNSDWVAESLSRFEEPEQSMVFHPPLTADRHLVEQTGDAVTLVNLNEHKGANIFYELARRMPDTQFVGVVGGHGQQVIKRGIPNVTIMEHGPDMKRVWERTRVLLMPSIYESYGLVAVEAGINGIPTIANPTPGLRENLGERGLFVDRENLGGWMVELQRLEVSAGAYPEASEYARGRAELALAATRDTLKEWVQWVG